MDMNNHICMCVYMYMFVCLCLCARMHKHEYIYLHICTWLNVYMYVYAYTHTHTYMYPYADVCCMVFTCFFLSVPSSIGCYIVILSISMYIPHDHSELSVVASQ